MAISTMLAIAIILLLPADSLHMAKMILLIIMIAALATISNTVNLVALGLNRERFDGLRK